MGRWTDASGVHGERKTPANRIVRSPLSSTPFIFLSILPSTYFYFTHPSPYILLDNFFFAANQSTQESTRFHYTGTLNSPFLPIHVLILLFILQIVISEIHHAFILSYLFNAALNIWDLEWWKIPHYRFWKHSGEKNIFLSIKIEKLKNFGYFPPKWESLPVLLRFATIRVLTYNFLR